MNRRHICEFSRRSSPIVPILPFINEFWFVHLIEVIFRGSLRLLIKSNLKCIEIPTAIMFQGLIINEYRVQSILQITFI